jgi:glycosyltransferase involved in cell wall biosynthesis
MKNNLKDTRNIPEEKFFTVQNWQDEEQFINFANNKTETKTSQPFTFMYLGNNGPVAGVEFLIKAFVKATIPNSRFIIAGSGSRTEVCKNLAKTLQVENIEFMPVADGKVPATQDLADVMLLPVKTGAAMSSIPSKLPAYMFSKKPIVGSLDLESDTARAILQSNCGIVVEPENEEKLVEALQEISNWELERIESCGEKGFDYAMEHLSKRSNLKTVVNTLLKVAE